MGMAYGLGIRLVSSCVLDTRFRVGHFLASRDVVSSLDTLSSPFSALVMHGVKAQNGRCHIYSSRFAMR
jgi:hypothetical protein